jgi:hypothetical protein
MRLIALRAVPDYVGEIPQGRTFICTDEERAASLVRQGYAERESDKWAGLHWPGETVFIFAGGPSLTAEQCESVRDRGRSIAINTSFRLAPWADVLYACDLQWWERYIDEARESFRGQLWTLDADAHRKFGIKHVESRPSPGLGKQKGVIHQGRNSGYQAVNLAYQARAKRIVLLGFDMKAQGKKKHWHGDHPGRLNHPLPYASWIQAFETMARDLRAENVEVLNATPGSALKCFTQVSLDECLQ